MLIPCSGRACQDRHRQRWWYSRRLPVCERAETVEHDIDSILRVAETLSDEILTKMRAPPKPDYPIIKPDTLLQYDAFILGIPTRYGIMPGQWKVRVSLNLMPNRLADLIHVGLLGRHRFPLDSW